MRNATAPKARCRQSSAMPSASGSWMGSETAMIRRLLISACVKRALWKSQPIILQADEILRPAVAVPVEQAVPGGFADRQDDEDGEQQQRRRQEDEERQPAAAAVPARGIGETGRSLSSSRASRFALELGGRGLTAAAAEVSFFAPRYYCWSQASCMRRRAVLRRHLRRPRPRPRCR